MDLPLLRNMDSVLFAKYESELLTPGLTRGRACWGGSPSSSSPSALPENPPCQGLLPQALGKLVILPPPPPGVKELVYKSCPPSLWAETQTRASSKAASEESHV